LDERNELVPAYMEAGMLRRGLLMLVLNACTSLLTSCTGGCWLHADAVRTEPAADCLTLFGGNSPTDNTVCAVPELGGVNNCTDSLTLPKLSASGNVVVVASGERIAWLLPSQSAPPDVAVVKAGGGLTNYVVSAMLGAQSITITVPVRK
jgi:hypothetical protein